MTEKRTSPMACTGIDGVQLDVARRGMDEVTGAGGGVRKLGQRIKKRRRRGRKRWRRNRAAK